MLSAQSKQELRWMMRLQWMFVALLSGLTWMIFNRELAVDLACGGLVSLLPSLLFAKLLFQHQGARKAKQIVHGFYVGEALKMGLTLLLFAGVMLWVHPTWWAFFMGFVVTQLGWFISPCVYLILRT